MHSDNDIWALVNGEGAPQSTLDITYEIVLLIPMRQSARHPRLQTPQQQCTLTALQPAFRRGDSLNRIRNAAFDAFVLTTITYHRTWRTNLFVNLLRTLRKV